MARATQAEKARLLIAAYRLLGQRMERAEAARHRGRKFAVSHRQTYRKLQQAAGLGEPLPAVEPTVAIAFKLPGQHGTRNRRIGPTQRLSLGQIVTRAVTALLDTVHQRRG